ncbi:hypothetical protein GS930_11840 [Rhodococcus hoagii]|nr:hypothetical protein [Prescottella equi]
MSTCSRTSRLGERELPRAGLQQRAAQDGLGASQSDDVVRDAAVVEHPGHGLPAWIVIDAGE